MRFVATIEPAADGWTVSLEGLAGGGPAPLRALDRTADDFPLPPRPVPGVVGAPPQSLWDVPDDLWEVYEAIATGAPSAEKNHVARFGHYLFEVLLGSATWSLMTAQANGEPIELALRHRPDDHPIARLPWEMMFDPVAGKHLAERRPPVAVVRLSAPAATATLGPLEMPLRVLFVVGARMDDPAIRAGTEYLGLLRRLGSGSSVLVHDIVLQATREAMKDAVERFRPSIVHFIGHGEPGHVELRRDPGLAPAGGQADVDRCDADAFFAALTPAGVVPAVVVLNACNSAGQSVSLHLTTSPLEAAPNESLAPGLVRRGVQMVIGMAGRVADHACRLFTRRFYETLLDGQQDASGARVNVALAAAEGRAAAIESFGGRVTTVDWAYPTITIDARLPGADVTLSDTAGAKWRAGAAALFRKSTPFCDRLDVLSHFGRWLRPRPGGGAAPPPAAAPGKMRMPAKAVFALVDESAKRLSPLVPGGPGGAVMPRGRSRFGMTRALQELALCAASEGMLPCLVSVPDDQPKSFAELALKITDALEQACPLFGLPFERRESQMINLALWRKGKPLRAPLHDDVMLELDTQPLASAAEARAIQLDLSALALTAWQGGQHQLVLMLDDVHQLTASLNELPTLIRAGSGAGTRDVPVPVVLSCRLPGQDKGVELAALNAFLIQNCVEKCLLSCFEEPRLAYEQSLLYGGRGPRVFQNRNEEDRAKAEEFFQQVDTFVCGVPSWLEEDFRIDVLLGILQEVLVTADDERVLKLLRSAAGAGGALPPGGGA